MIGSQYDTRLPTYTRSRRGWWAYVLVVASLLVIVLTAYAHAATLRVCFRAPTPDDNAATAPVFLNGNPFHPDALAGSALSGTRRCASLPIPGTLAKGVDFATTMKFVNSAGEVSGASNAIPFRLPGSPTIPVLDSVSIDAP